jgi:hypothetical protein
VALLGLQRGAQEEVDPATQDAEGGLSEDPATVSG